MLLLHQARWNVSSPAAYDSAIAHPDATVCSGKHRSPCLHVTGGGAAVRAISAKNSVIATATGVAVKLSSASKPCVATLEPAQEIREADASTALPPLTPCS